MGNNVQSPRQSNEDNESHKSAPSYSGISREGKETKKEANQKKNEKLKNTKTQQSKVQHDVMISYSHKERDIMLKVREYLEKNGHKVWTDQKLKSGQQFLTSIGEAILEAKVFLPLLSKNYTLSHVCRDEQALAYLSAKPITPLSLEPRYKIQEYMDLGMRLQLARYQWHELLSAPGEKEHAPVGETFPNVMDKFLVTFRKCLQEAAVADQRATAATGSSGEDGGADEAAGDAEFWERQFANADSVGWDRFWSGFLEEYDQRVHAHYGQGLKTRLSYILVRELDVDKNNDQVLKGVYREYCRLDDKVVSLWRRLHHQVADELAGSEVLEMDSSVRVAYIEHLGQVKSDRAVSILLDLLDSGDSDMKATAALSLAKTGDNSPQTITKLLQCLDSEDRLVRESGCLALGHIRAEEAVPKLIQLWRNDVIANVREACELSLRLVGGDAADKAIYVTNMLSREIRDLTQNNA